MFDILPFICNLVSRFVSISFTKGVVIKFDTYQGGSKLAGV